jgi:uncharacterized membrane protein HdeD (DUF308 family)
MNGNVKTLGNQLTDNWWLIALRGVAAVIFGILAFVWPGITLMTLVVLFGIYALINGILALAHALSAPKGYPRFGGLVVEGLISIAAGLAAFVWPGITALALLLLIAAWAIITGLLEILAAIELRKTISHEWLLILAGIVSLIFGVVMFLQPAAGALAFIWWIGAFAIVFGAILIGLAFRLREWGHRVAPPVQGPA